MYALTFVLYNFKKGINYNTSFYFKEDNTLTNTMVKLENISKNFGDFNAVKKISLDIKQGEFLTLLGPSGCGKTTTLRMIAGFEKPTSGNVKINNEIVNNVEPYNRKVNTVFQNYSLFPHMNIFNNVAFGLKMKKVNKSEIADRVSNVLKLVQLEEQADKKPQQLSGGQQQRVAIARAIVNNPEVLLLDEPLGALDLKLRKQMQIELKQLQESIGITFIYVTHDQEEALTMSDRIVVMNGGDVEQVDHPRNIYEKPKSLFVANFIGETNILKGKVHTNTSDKAVINLGCHSFSILNEGNFGTGENVNVSIRPENISFIKEQQDHEKKLTITIDDVIYIGSLSKVIGTLEDGQKITIQASNQLNLTKGSKEYITWNEQDSIIYKTNTTADKEMSLT